MTDLIARAQEFAHDAHDSIRQTRKYAPFPPYHVHTDEVASIVATVTNDEDSIIAANLHDVLEDVTPKNPFYNFNLIQDLFGRRAAQFVLDLTDLYTKEAYPQWNRRLRKQKERERLGLTAPESQTVKLADLISNTQDIVINDPGFAVTYLKEKQQLLPHLTSGDKTLWARAARLADEGCQVLGVDRW